MSEVRHTDLLPLPQPQTHLVGRNLHYYEETDSTNTRALETCVDGDVFVAEHQTAGRGRHGKLWHSAPGLGLWFSVCLAAPLHGICFASALTVRDAVADKISLSLRWPNDLYAGNRKVCGILVEQRHEWFALGIGINVNHAPDDFPRTLRYRAGSLAMASGGTWDRGVLLLSLLERLDDMVVRLRAGESGRFRDDWISACDIIGRKIRRGAISGQVTAVDKDGALLVQTRVGVQRVTAGDVSIVG